MQDVMEYINEEVPSKLRSNFIKEFKSYSQETRLSGVFYSNSVLSMVKQTVINDSEV